jgi:hypothetical protein
MPVRILPVLFRAYDDIEIEPGVVLRSGIYAGKSKEVGFESVTEGIKWTKPQYLIELTAGQLTAMGVNYSARRSAEHDITKLVRSGQISVDPSGQPS